MEVTVECSKRLLDGDVSIVDTRRLFLKYSDGSSPIEKAQSWVFYNQKFHNRILRMHVYVNARKIFRK